MEFNRREGKCKKMFKSLPFNYLHTDNESESSLNPNAMEFVPSRFKTNDKPMGMGYGNGNVMKTEATSTTTLRQRELVGDADHLHAQRQLFELLHQLGDKQMPLKAIRMSLSPDGQGINVQFKAEHNEPGRKLLDESLCQVAALNLELNDRSFMPTRLPNVLAANFMLRISDVLNEKIDPSSANCCTDSSTSETVEPKTMTVSSNFSSSTSLKAANTTALGAGGGLSDKSSLPRAQSPQHQQQPCSISLPKQQQLQPTRVPNDLSNWSSKLNTNAWSKVHPRARVVSPDSQHKYDTNSMKAKPCIKRSSANAPRSTFTSLMRQSEVQRRLGLSKVDKKTFDK
ncbi:CG6441 [Drosophila busckii]|uniref:CG6441 n=1 Tax=Drosophila busckii TaxID=30019 RepID=A0A0M5IWB0_DROBS|nr:uncharacterized protein LOC108607722 [Drosophila busckii]ALC38831.1 CG6441 [Drosophila busckii]